MKRSTVVRCALLCATAVAAVALDCSKRIVDATRTPATGLPPPVVPEAKVEAFTRCGTVHVQQLYVDDTGGGKGLHIKATEQSVNASIVVHRKVVDEMDARARAHSKKQLPIRPTERFIYQGAVAAREAIQGQECLVIGSNRIWVESLLLALGARGVTVLEYNKLTYRHPQVKTVTVAEYEAARANGSWTTRFPCAVSLSSYDHDGLGRYGDPIAPDGDLLSMDVLRQDLLTPNATLLFQVPVGLDIIGWNVYRRYGRVRLPLILDGFAVHDAFGMSPFLFDRVDPLTKPIEPVFVLRPLTTGPLPDVARTSITVASDRLLQTFPPHEPGNAVVLQLDGEATVHQEL